jgi:drug/metabolite transporter superfamily protein YnfA
MKRVYFAFGLLALAGFIASLLVHLAALSGIDVEEQIPAVWALHGGIFVVAIVYTILNRNKAKVKPSWDMLGSAFPRWARLVGAGLLAYAVLNFVLFITATEGGNPIIRDGKYHLLNHGALIRELTLAEYAAAKANVIRGFSGHWMVFYFILSASFLLKQETPAVQGECRSIAANGR